MKNKNNLVDKVKIKLSVGQIILSPQIKKDIASLATSMKGSDASELVIPLFINFVKKHDLTFEQQAHTIRHLFDSGQVDKRSKDHSDKLISLSNRKEIKTFFDNLKPRV